MRPNSFLKFCLTSLLIPILRALVSATRFFVAALFFLIAIHVLDSFNHKSLIFGAASAQQTDSLQTQARIKNVRFGPDGAKTRIVFDVVGNPNFELMGNDRDKGRLIIEFANIKNPLSINAQPDWRKGKGHVARHVHGGAGKTGASRYILDFARTARIDNVFVLDPTRSLNHHRLVIDLYDASRSDYMASLPRIAGPNAGLIQPAESARNPFLITQSPSVKPSRFSSQLRTGTQHHSHSTQDNSSQKIQRQENLRLSVPEEISSPQKNVASRNVARSADKLAKNNVDGAEKSVADIIAEEESRKQRQEAATSRARNNNKLFASKADQNPQNPNSNPGKNIVTVSGPQKITIVIDPGHGGGHPGAVGQLGTLEKDVNLAAAQTLSQYLVKTGRYRVVMTRGDDRKVELDQRAQIARDVGANLFISLHADGNDDETLRGSSVYTLSDEGAKRSLEAFDDDLAEFSSDLGPILFDVVQKKTKSESSRFASMVLARLGNVTPLVKNAQRKEDLKVLLRPDVPAVLLEMAFISNINDEGNLTNEKWRNKTMGAVSTAIDDYFFNDASLRADLPGQTSPRANLDVGTTGGLE